MKIVLPPAECKTELSVEQVLMTRRSHREFSTQSVSIKSLSQLLWAAQGINGPDGKRVTPSAGASYPLAVHVAVGVVSGLDAGVYEYQVNEHALLQITSQDKRSALCEAALDEQPWLASAAFVIALSADLKASAAHFHEQPPTGERGKRYAYIETGAAAENVYLQASALDLGAVLVAGFNDADVKALLQLPNHLEPTALLCVGSKPGS